MKRKISERYPIHWIKQRSSISMVTFLKLTINVHILRVYRNPIHLHSQGYFYIQHIRTIDIGFDSNVMV